ncbi:MAG: FAD-dependent oxidoreductase [Nocardioides sp.]
MGAGHAHLFLLRNADRLARAGYRTTLVAPRWFDYSGVASAVAAGGRDPAEGRIDVAALSRDKGVAHRLRRVIDVDPEARTLTADDGTELAWDVVSFNIGSVAAMPQAAEVSSEVVGVKPLSDLTRLRVRLARPPAGRGHHLTVVGAGPSGVELAAHLAARPDTDRVHLLEAGPRVGGFLPTRAAERLGRLLEQRGVVTMTNVEVGWITEDEVVLNDGTRVPHDTAVLATGLGAPPLATREPLGGPDGFPVRATLQHRDHDDVYAAGDCADFLPRSLPHIGVHGVRQGPVLLAGLEARAAGEPAPVYQPQRQALSILHLGAGTALAVRGRWWWLGRSSFLIKRTIDRGWIAGYRT